MIRNRFQTTHILTTDINKSQNDMKFIYISAYHI